MLPKQFPTFYEPTKPLSLVREPSVDVNLPKHATLNGHTPAMAHGLTTEVWSVRKMLEMVTA